MTSAQASLAPRPAFALEVFSDLSALTGSATSDEMADLLLTLAGCATAEARCSLIVRQRIAACVEEFNRSHRAFELVLQDGGSGHSLASYCLRFSGEEVSSSAWAMQFNVTTSTAAPDKVFAELTGTLGGPDQSNQDNVHASIRFVLTLCKQRCVAQCVAV